MMEEERGPSLAVRMTFAFGRESHEKGMPSGVNTLDHSNYYDDLYG